MGWEYRRSKQAENVEKGRRKTERRIAKAEAYQGQCTSTKCGLCVCQREGVVWLKHEPLHLFSSSSSPLYVSPNAPLGHLANTRSNNSSTLFQIFCCTKKIVKRFSRFVKLFAQLFCTIKQQERLQWKIQQWKWAYHYHLTSCRWYPKKCGIQCVKSLNYFKVIKNAKYNSTIFA